MKKNLLFTLMIAAAGFSACNKSDIGRRETETPGGCFPVYPDCSNVVCTMQFVAVELKVKDANGAAVTLDSFVVTDASGTPLPPSAGGNAVFGSGQPGTGTYFLINDGWLQGHRNSSASVRAKGFVKGMQVFDEPYTISADCCHVSKASGKDVIVVP